MSIQILPGEVDPRDGPSPTQELEREVARLCVEEASSRESLVQSLADSRKRVQEAREAWEYHERLASAYRGRFGFIVFLLDFVGFGTV